LRGSSVALVQGTVGVLDRSGQPPLHVQHHPRLVGVGRHRLDDQVMRAAVGKRLDVQIEHPVGFPAALPARGHRVDRRPPHPVAVGDGVEDLLNPLLQPPGHHGLGDPVGDGGHAEHPDPASLPFGIGTARTGGGEVAARGHPVPDLVQVALEILLERLDRAPVHTRRPSIGLDVLVRPPKPPAWRSQTACPWTSARPLDSSRMVPGCPNELAQMARPLGSTPITRASSLLQAGPPADPATVLSASRFPPLARAPCRRPHPCSRQCRGLPSHVPRKSRRPGSRRLHAGHRLASTRVPARLLLRPDHRPSSGAVQTTFDPSAAIRSRSPSRVPT
jgi:hypothetical protein